MSRLIGITVGLRPVRTFAGEQPGHAVLPTYTTMVRAAGAIPVLLTPVTADHVPHLLDRLDGILLSGGGDVDPSAYGGETLPSVYGVDPARDEFEFAVARVARERRLPTLCICRGLQVLNVALGGSLVEDIPTRIPDALPHSVDTAPDRSVHAVAVTPGSTTAKALGTDEVGANSLHHQSVDRVADSLVVTGRTSDGVVEALAPADDDWPMWAVQWHPEYLGPDDAPSLRLFEALVAAAS